MTPGKRLASTAARIVVLLGVLVLLAAAADTGMNASPGSPGRGVLSVIAPFAAAVALIAGAIALDRWACREPPEPTRGFEPIVRADDDRTEP